MPAAGYKELSKLHYMDASSSRDVNSAAELARTAWKRRG